MSHFLHRSLPKPTVADVTPRPMAIERHIGTTRVPRPRVLKPPIG